MSFICKQHILRSVFFFSFFSGSGSRYLIAHCLGLSCLCSLLRSQTFFVFRELALWRVYIGHLFCKISLTLNLWLGCLLMIRFLLLFVLYCSWYPVSEKKHRTCLSSSPPHPPPSCLSSCCSDTLIGGRKFWTYTPHIHISLNYRLY